MFPPFPPPCIALASLGAFRSPRYVLGTVLPRLSSPDRTSVPHSFQCPQVVLRSARLKRLDELKEACDDLRNKMKINDWPAIQTGFDELNKRLERYSKAEGAIGTPRVYIKMLVELEDALNTTLADKVRLLGALHDRKRAVAYRCRRALTGARPSPRPASNMASDVLQTPLPQTPAALKRARPPCAYTPAELPAKRRLSAAC